MPLIGGRPSSCSKHGEAQIELTGAHRIAQGYRHGHHRWRQSGLFE